MKTKQSPLHPSPDRRANWSHFLALTTVISLAVLAVTTLNGCVGYVGNDGYGGAVIAPEPDLWLYGDGFDHGYAVHDYSRRGHESRGGGRR